MKRALLVLLLIYGGLVSAQGDITWNMAMNLASSSSGNQHPRVATDANGNPLVLWNHANRAMFSRWNGTAFTTPVMLHPGTMTIAGAAWMGPNITSRGDTVYVVFKETPEVDTSSHIQLVRSFDGGNSFSAPVQVDNIGDSLSRFPTVTIDAQGHPVVAFMKFNQTFGEARWVVARSTDYGQTFSGDTKASGWSSATSDVCDCCPGAIHSEGSTVAVLYRDNDSDNRDTWAGLSFDSGISFTSGIGVDQLGWMVSMCPASGPDGFLLNDTIYSVFMNGASGMSRTYFSKSPVSSSSPWVVSLTGSITGLNNQNYPRIATDGTAAAIVWKQNVSGSDQLPILFTSNLYEGFPVQYDTVDLNYVTNADVALDNGNIFVVWQDDNSGTIKYRSGVYTVTTDVTQPRDRKAVEVFPNPADERINIRIPPGNKNSMVIVSDALGQKVFESDIINQDRLEINTGNWKNGIYTVSVRSDKVTETIKVRVSR